MWKEGVKTYIKILLSVERPTDTQDIRSPGEEETQKSAKYRAGV
jgi:LDH2 family malate/lactate/ureidoglycolate dehydrogenase